jgi:GNAT superfamily N-acetyltransferase
MALVTRLATTADAAIVGDMIHALDVHYRGLAEAPPASAGTAMAKHVIETREGALFFLAFDGDRAVGVACCGILRPGRSLEGVLFLKDLFTHADARGRGVGTALLSALARHCVDTGIGRIDFTTERDNAGARRLYDRLGGARQDKVMYRFDGEGLHRLANVLIE